MVKKSIAAVGVALMLNGIAYAADSGPADSGSAATGNGADTSKADPPLGGWAAQGQLGLIMSRGNTVTNSGNASFDAAHVMGRWTFSGGFAALYASSAGISTQQDTTVHLQADRQLSKRTFWFVTGQYDRNLFTGFAYQESIASGGGFNLIQTPATQLAVELGIGDRRQEPQVLTKILTADGTVTFRTPEPVVNDAVLVGAVNYSHTITSTTKVVNTLLVQYGSSDTLTTDNLALQVKVDASLSLAVGLQLVNNSSPPPGNVKHTDTVMTVNLVYALKNPKLSATATGPALASDLSLYNLP